MKKISLQEIEFQSDILFKICPSPETYCEAFISYLKSNGWTEEEYRQGILNGQGN